MAAAHAETTPPDRRRCLEMAIASLRLWLARRRAHLAGVVEQAGFLASPVACWCGEEIAIANDLRAVALIPAQIKLQSRESPGSGDAA